MKPAQELGDSERVISGSPRPGELWECIDPKRACACKTPEAFTLNYTSSFYRLAKPFILLELVYAEDRSLDVYDNQGAWKVMTEMGVMYVQSTIDSIAVKVEDATG